MKQSYKNNNTLLLSIHHAITRRRFNGFAVSKLRYSRTTASQVRIELVCELISPSGHYVDTGFCERVAYGRSNNDPNR